MSKLQTTIRNPFLIDGATGSELARRGVDISLPLWSARALIDAPGALAAVHEDYLRAGADAITSNTFRTHRRSLAKAGMGERARELTTRAVEIAKRARDAVKPSALVLGCVGPLEDSYSPQFAPDEHACRREHGEMIEHLLEAGVDRILIETMNNMREARAAMREAQARAPGQWIISFCTRSAGDAGMLLSGERVDDVLGDASGAAAVGLNCVAAPAVEAQVRFLRDHLNPAVQIIAYANTGVQDEHGKWTQTDAADPARYAEYAGRWREAGATMIGGCCGTTPETIRALARLLQ